MSVETVGKPDLKVADDIYRFTWECGIEAELERVTEHRDELTGELTIRTSRPPSPGLLHSARLNLVSTQARRTLSAALAKRDPDLDWDAVVEQVCFLARERYRNGEPAIDMRTYIPQSDGRWKVEPFVEADGGGLLFADGGTGKSFTATAISVTAASGTPVIGRLHGAPCPVLYLDWETSADVFRERVNAISTGAGINGIPPIFYRRMTVSLAEAADSLRREVVKLGVGLAVVDSLGAARGGEPESADVTIRMFTAARKLGIPWLGVDHVAKSMGNDSSRPFGSTYSHNLSRLTWSMDKAQEEGSENFVVSLRNRKRNNGRVPGRLGYRIDVKTDDREQLVSVRFTNCDLTEVPGLAEKLPLSQRILAELKSGPVAQTDLAETLGADLKAVNARIGELVKYEKVVRLEDRRVALRAREAS